MGNQEKNRVCLGSRVTIRFADGELVDVAIDGRGDLAAGVISAASPLGRALLAARVGDQLTYLANGKTQTITILQVFEQTPEWDR